MTRADWHRARRSIRQAARARAFAEGRAYVIDGDRLAESLRALPDRVQNALLGLGIDASRKRFENRRSLLLCYLRMRREAIAAGNDYEARQCDASIARVLGKRPAPIVLRVDAGELARRIQAIDAAFAAGTLR
jgi:hypothetical protein